MTDTKKIDDGGPAFPHMAADGHPDYRLGLSLRDHFAAQAIPAIIRQCAGDLTFRDGTETAEQYFARKAYEVSDAMLSARKAGEA